MPFDGTNFIHTQGSEPLPLAPASLGFWERLGWLFCSLGLWRIVRIFTWAKTDSPLQMQAAQVLRQARAIIEAEENWAKGAYHTRDDRRCAVGALHAASRRHGGSVGAKAHRFLLAVARSRGFDHVESMNDRSTHAEVLAAFDLAIASAQRG